MLSTLTAVIRAAQASSSPRVFIGYIVAVALLLAWPLLRAAVPAAAPLFLPYVVGAASRLGDSETTSGSFPQSSNMVATEQKKNGLLFSKPLIIWRAW